MLSERNEIYDSLGGVALSPARFARSESTLRCISINTHRGHGPKVPYLLSQVSMEEAERIELLHDTKAYTYFIAEWLNQHKEQFDVVGLQEVFNGVLGLGDRLLGKFRQRDHYRVISGFKSALPHGVGFAGFRYENLLLSQLSLLNGAQTNYLLPGKVYFLAACGFTLAPFRFNGRVIWIGNTHLHPYSPKERARQAASLVRSNLWATYQSFFLVTSILCHQAVEKPASPQERLTSTAIAMMRPFGSCSMPD